MKKYCEILNCKSKGEVHGVCRPCFTRQFPFNLIGDNILITVYEGDCGGYDFEPVRYTKRTRFTTHFLSITDYNKMYYKPRNVDFCEEIRQYSIQIGKVRTATTTLFKRELMEKIYQEAIADTTLPIRLLAKRMK